MRVTSRFLDRVATSYVIAVNLLLFFVMVFCEVSEEPVRDYPFDFLVFFFSYLACNFYMAYRLYPRR